VTDFLSLAEAKQQLNITVDSYDDELPVYVSGACLVIERLAGAVLPRAVTENVRQRAGSRAMVLLTRPVMSLTSMTALDGSGTYDVTSVYVDRPKAGIVRRKDDARIVGGPWSVVYQAGRADIPANINLAARMLVEHLWETQRGELGPPSLDLTGGIGESVPSVWFAVPNKVQEMLEGELIPTVAY
jgi:hypothetical protein